MEDLGKFLEQHIVAIALAAMGIGFLLLAMSERKKKDPPDQNDNDDDFQQPFALT